MMMIERMAAQGDLLFRRIPELPTSLNPVAPTGGRYVVALSVNGNHHTLPVEGVELFKGPDPLRLFLRLTEPREVVHARPHDTHAPVMLAAGVWEIRRQREYTPEGFRAVED